MPHLIVHCSESVTRLAAPEDIIDTVFEAAASSGLFSASGVGGILHRGGTVLRTFLAVFPRAHAFLGLYNARQPILLLQQQRRIYCQNCL